jgi:hypothetical protein
MEGHGQKKSMGFKLRFQLQWNRHYMLYERANLNFNVNLFGSSSTFISVNRACHYLKFESCVSSRLLPQCHPTRYLVRTIQP